MNQTFDGKHSYNFTFTGLLPFTDYILVTVVEYKQVTADDGISLGPEVDYSEPNYILTQGLLLFGYRQWFIDQQVWVGRRESELSTRALEKQLARLILKSLS